MRKTDDEIRNRILEYEQKAKNARSTREGVSYITRILELRRILGEIWEEQI